MLREHLCEVKENISANLKNTTFRDFLELWLREINNLVILSKIEVMNLTLTPI